MVRAVVCCRCHVMFAPSTAAAPAPASAADSALSRLRKVQLEVEAEQEADLEQELGVIVEHAQHHAAKTGSSARASSIEQQLHQLHQLHQLPPPR